MRSTATLAFAASLSFRIPGDRRRHRRSMLLIFFQGRRDRSRCSLGARAIAGSASLVRSLSCSPILDGYSYFRRDLYPETED